MLKRSMRSWHNQFYSSSGCGGRTQWWRKEAIHHQSIAASNLLLQTLTHDSKPYNPHRFPHRTSLSRFQCSSQAILHYKHYTLKSRYAFHFYFQRSRPNGRNPQRSSTLFHILVVIGRYWQMVLCEVWDLLGMGLLISSFVEFLFEVLLSNVNFESCLLSMLF